MDPKTDDNPKEKAAATAADPSRRNESVAPSCEAPDAFLAALVESSDDAIVGKSLEGTIRSWNPGAERLFGYTAEEAVGRSIGITLPEEREHEEASIRERLQRGERVEQFETERLHKDGHRVPVSVSISPIRNGDGNLVGASMVARDIGPRKQAEQAARRSRETLEALIETAPVAINVLDRDGVVHLWNPVSERMFGWSRDEVVGRFNPVVSPDQQEEYRKHLEATFTGEPLEGKETVRRDRHGNPIHIALWSAVLEDPDGQPDRLVSIAVDVGDRKRAEASLRESEERFRSLADNIAQLAWIAHADGWIFWYNKRWFDYTGTTLEEMEGWGWRRVHHPDHVDRVVATYRRAIEKGEVWEDTFPLRAADGAWRWFLSRAVPIRDSESGDITRWMGTNTDITERMEMETVLREADRRKDEFLATLAHELRNPLAPIASGLELLRQSREDRELADRVLGTLERQTDHLVRLVDDLLDISRITRGKVDLRRREVELSEVVHAAVEASRPLLDEGHHRLEVDLPAEPVRLDADPTRLAQVFSNLLNNAARYTPEGGHVALSAERGTGPGGGCEAVVRVRDSGEGIPEERLEQIFDLFVQGGEGTRQGRGGLGIGLTLVKSMVELHGGRVEAHSAGPGEGSEFVVSLPALPALEGRGAAGGAEAGTARSRNVGRPGEDRDAGSATPEDHRLRVVVVDDNRDAADSLRDLLEMLGHRAWAAYDGEEAVAVVQERDPQVVLLDLGMPRVDGYEAARRLRRLPGGGERVLVAVTGWGQDADRARTREAGFDHHLVKPADLDQLRHLLDEAADELR